MNPKWRCVEVSLLVLFLILLGLATWPRQVAAQSQTSITSGTLNLILANKNGFVIAADSRRSSKDAFLCGTKLQTYCDDSQKLFRTSPHSALVIAGFAVGEAKSPLDLRVASVLRRRFGLGGFPADDAAGNFPDIVRNEFSEALEDVATLSSPGTVSSDLRLWVAFARLNEQHAPVLRQIVFNGTWSQSGQLNVAVPKFQGDMSPEFVVAHFKPITQGVTCVADAVLAGIFKTTDPIINSYYRKLKNNQRDEMSLDAMRSLAVAILRETKRFTGVVGGSDQIGVFPADGQVTFGLPTNLPKETRLLPNIMRWEGINCTGGTPTCGNPLVSFRVDMRKFSQPYLKMYVLSRFKDIPVILGSNIFVNDEFDGVTFKWKGGDFYLFGGNFRNCTVELPESASPPSDRLPPCRIARKKELEMRSDYVGSTPMTQYNDCIQKDAAGNCTAVSLSLWSPQP